MIRLASTIKLSHSAPQGSALPKLAELDSLIGVKKPITYRGGDFGDFNTVAKCIEDHQPLKTALISADLPMQVRYQDPCDCCIPAHGQRKLIPDSSHPAQLIAHLRRAKQRRAPLDLVFTTLNLYEGAKKTIEREFPETKLIVVATREQSASELRRRGIPAIDVNDYDARAPLNAIITLVMWNEMPS